MKESICGVPKCKQLINILNIYEIFQKAAAATEKDKRSTLFNVVENEHGKSIAELIDEKHIAKLTIKDVFKSPPVSFRSKPCHIWLNMT